MTEITQYIVEWIQYLSKPQENIGGISVCPFAKNAKYKIVEVDEQTVVLPDSETDLVIHVLPDTISQNNLSSHCKALNESYVDYVFLPDHKDRKTFINGVRTNNDAYNLILCQPKEKLIKARESLMKTDYYKYWSKEYLKEITGIEL